MCPHCRAFITVDDKVCPYCDAQLTARAIDVRMPDDLLGGLLPATRFLTTLILIVNSGLFVATILYSMNTMENTGALMNLDPRTLIIFGAKFGPFIAAGQLWRLVTAGFLHGGLIHMAFNSISLMDVGAHVEEVFGMSRMAVIYVVSTVAGFGLSYWWSPTTSVGASAGIFGLLGAMLAWGMKWEGTAYGSAVKSMYSRWVVYGLVMSLMGMIDMAAHVGGLAGGFAVGFIAGEPNKDRTMDRIWDIAMYLCIVIVLASFAQVALTLVPALLSSPTSA
jgi:rhomboid protease GluP